MVDKKDPHQENSPVDFDDDEDIIELTDEVIVKPKDDDEIINLQDTDAAVPNTQANIPVKTEKKEPTSDDEDDIFDLGGTAQTDSLEDEAVIDLDEAFGDDENAMEEDDIIASAIEESLGPDDENLAEDRIKLTDKADTSAENDDEVIILNKEDDEPATESDHAAVAAEKGEGVFETEEEIELEYESDEDEYDFFALDDNKPLEELETITMADEDPDDAGDEDIDFDPVANLDFNSDEDDAIIPMDAEPPAEPNLMAFDDEETLEFGDAGGLPDLTDEMEFEFDDEDDENGFADADDQVTEEDLSAITAEEIRQLAAVDDLPDSDDDIDLEFGGEDDLSDIEDIDNLESEVETLSIEELDDSTAEEEDIIEITEFDEHFPEEDEKKLEYAGVSSASDSDEDDFLELIEVEEDDTAEDEEVIEFSNSEEQIDEDEIDNFFNETLDDEPVFEYDEIEPLEDTPALSTDMAMATAPPAAEDEEFDFSFNSSEISQQVDRLDTFLSDDPAAEPEVASLPAGPLAEEETVDESQPEIEDAAESLPVTPDQIDSIIERVIKDKFGGNIENIIYEIIEKAVSKEIDRLKGALLGDRPEPGDND